MKIYVIDKEPEIANLIKDMLYSYDHNVFVYTDYKVLLNKLDDSVDLIISGMLLDDINGFELSEKVAEIVGLSPPKTLLTSMDVLNDKIKTAEYKSILGVVAKPFSIEKFNTIIRVLEKTRNSCPCRIKGLINCPEIRKKNETPEILSKYCNNKNYSLCPDYEIDCGKKLKNWIEQHNKKFL